MCNFQVFAYIIQVLGFRQVSPVIIQNESSKKNEFVSPFSLKIKRKDFFTYLFFFPHLIKHNLDENFQSYEIE
jgi:hypothetical protein